ncbi:hypothetical protein IIA15_00315 [candidate division TA06 bacterium]|nr:hypothetical protein [candidate division TA06 bacterium]
MSDGYDRFLDREINKHNAERVPCCPYCGSEYYKEFGPCGECKKDIIERIEGVE